MLDYWGCFGAHTVVCDGVFYSGKCGSEALCVRGADTGIHDYGDTTGADYVDYPGGTWAL